MATLRLFASARDAAGTGRDTVPGATVAEVLATASARYGERFTAVLGTCRIWVNGEPGERDAPVNEADEIAVLPPVSGGADDGRGARPSRDVAGGRRSRSDRAEAE